MKSIDLSATVKKEILPKVGKELGIKNLHAIPQISKVKVSVGVGKIARKSGSSNAMDEGMLEKISKNIATITSQKPRTHKSKKAISNFKLREGMVVGLSVTLRGNRAIDFINKLVNVTFPRVRDFRGLSLKSFDGNGNYSTGLKDYTVFPEVKPEDAEFVHGVEITVCTTAKTDHEAKALLAALGFPFQKDTSEEEAAEEMRKKAEKEARAAAEEATKAEGLVKKEKEEEPKKKDEEKESEDSEQSKEKDSQDSKK